MNREQAIELVRTTFQNTFDKARFTYFLKNLLNQYDESKAFAPIAGTYIKEMYREYIASYERLGTYTDAAEQKVDLLIVHLKKTSSLERARTTQRNFVATYLKDRGEKDAALAAFVSPDPEDWRFSLITMEYRFEQGVQGRMKVKEDFTPARRWSFLVGTHENSHTAQSRFAPILQEDRYNPTLVELGEAFNIERVTKEFFEKYRDLFFRVNDELDRLRQQYPAIRQEFERKQIRTADFAKKLLGQIVFLYFLQKKGWFGVHRDKEWGSGSRHFLRELFEKKHTDYRNFFNDVLEPLFYEALRLDRSHADDYYRMLNCRIPFLNGGLFDPINNYDWVHTDLLLPNDLFSDTTKTREGDTGAGILDIFDRYNFTVKEDEPLEKDVAVDPEMLGKVFENLLEVKDRKSKGTYYTPREIVHYICQQSLIQYLDTTLNPIPPAYQDLDSNQTGLFGNTGRSGQLKLEVRHDNMTVPREDLEFLVRFGESVSENEARVMNVGRETSTYSFKLPQSIRTHARQIDEKLANIKICDPAIGSGAFPVGMMSEIVRARQTLSSYLDAPDRTPYNFKRDCIQHALYGVDIDPGAVEIAKLRLWLSLVVDEDDIRQIKPLPNLDYKILCGNSLLSVEKNLFNNELFKELERLKPLLFDETRPRQKAEYKQQIDRLIEQITNGHAEFDFEVYFSEVFHEKGGFDVVIGNPPYVALSKLKSQAEALKKQGYETYSKTSDVYCLFYEKGVQILKKRGALCYITSNSWMRTKYGESLRKYFAEQTNPLILINFENTQIFDEAIVESSILLTQKAPFRHNLKAALFKSEFDKHRSSIAGHFAQKHLVLQKFHSDGWIVGNQTTIALKQKVEEGSILLGNSGVTINYGIKTGYNKAFVIDNETKNDITNQNITNLEIFKRLLRGRDIEKYSYHWSGLWLINSHNGLKSKNIPPVDVKKDYPDIYTHLSKFEKQLEKRTDQGKHWSNLRDCAYLKELEKPKIIWGELSDEPKFAYDDGGHFLNNTVFMMTGNHLKYLLAILNSRLSKWYFEQISTTSGMGTNRWLKYKIEQMPIKPIPPTNPRPFEILVDYVTFLKCISPTLTSGKERTMFAFFEHVIDGCVYELYFEETMKQSKKDILQFLQDLPEIRSDMTDEEKMSVIRPVFTELFKPDYPVSQRLTSLDSLREVRIINGLEL